MNREDKQQLVQDLVNRIKESNGNFYVADIAELSVNDTNTLRKACNAKGVHLQVVKNKLVLKALEQLEITDAALVESLKGPSSLMLAEDIKAPVKLIKEMRRTKKKPLLKAAYIEESLYVGDDQLDTVLKLKSKNEIIGEIIGMLQAPAGNVISALQSPMRALASIFAEEGEGKLADRARK
ncbi:MAG: 50S ribosomal protein L10 [Bacteroidetes bacterium]|nr:50S ribosomal protein L10 [Bacteroidota bacterium]